TRLSALEMTALFLELSPQGEETLRDIALMGKIDERKETPILHHSNTPPLQSFSPLPAAIGKLFFPGE
ncbi:MAG: hypothetical protein ACE5D1_06750, partial [Fidelibacterota bacterium]